MTAPLNHSGGIDETLRMLLLRLEAIQREIEEVSQGIALLLSSRQVSSSEPMSLSEPPSRQEEGEVDLSELSSEQSTQPCIDLVSWLKSRQITLLRTAESSALDEAFDRLAWFLGERFTNIRRFYEAVKRRVAGYPYPREIELRDETPRAISDICQFAKELYDNGFLSYYRYYRGSRRLVFEPQMEGRVINFFNGDWLERYVLLTAIRHAEAFLPKTVRPGVLTKAVIALPDGQETELDILLGLPDCVIWMECKTGDWRKQAVKLGRVARMLRIPISHAALVILDKLTSQQKQTISALLEMTVISPEEVRDFVERAMGITAPESNALGFPFASQDLSSLANS